MSSSSSQIIQKPHTVVNNNFSIPPGTVDIRHENDDDLYGQQDETNAGSTNQDESPAVVDYEIIPIEDIYEDSTNQNPPSESGTSLPVPQSMSVVEQIYAIAEDGTGFVDVIIEVPDMPGVSQIDVRVAKV